MIKFQNVHVKFVTAGSHVAAVQNVSLAIRQGEVFGIVGASGAGKSTLLRTINLLQRPAQGKVFVDGRDITGLKGEELRRLRSETGMIFQHFNLIHTKKVFDNVAFAMKAGGKSKTEIAARVPQVLELVGLTDKADAYPSNLSGGQKQRVGIARAIANNPKILLCDEPTSALDLETTNSILELLQEINQRLKITTVIISHEMNVIKHICDRVAVMQSGQVVELNNVYNVFATPVHEFTKKLVEHTFNLDLPERVNAGRVLYKLVYRDDKAEESVISDTISHYSVTITIMHGKIEYIAGNPLGILIVGLDGSSDEVEKALGYMRTRVAEVEVFHG